MRKFSNDIQIYTIVLVMLKLMACTLIFKRDDYIWLHDLYRFTRFPKEHPYNRDGYRYVLAEADPHAPFRQVSILLF